MCGMCNKCSKLVGILLLIIGIFFLLRDLSIWDFWGIQWWTAAFLLVGVVSFCSACCPMCQSASGCCGPVQTMTKKKK